MSRVENAENFRDISVLALSKANPIGSRFTHTHMCCVWYFWVFFAAFDEVEKKQVNSHTSNTFNAPLLYFLFILRLRWTPLDSRWDLTRHSTRFRHFVFSVMRRCRLSISKLSTRTHGAPLYGDTHSVALSHTHSVWVRLTHIHVHSRLARVELSACGALFLFHSLSESRFSTRKNPAPQKQNAGHCSLSFLSIFVRVFGKLLFFGGGGMPSTFLFCLNFIKIYPDNNIIAANISLY